MSDPVRIDQYLCIDIEKIMVDELEEIIGGDLASSFQEDLDAWAELQQAAEIVLKNYKVIDYFVASKRI